MSSRRILTIGFLVFFSSVLLVMLALELSPLNRFIAWTQLHNKTYTTQQEALELALKVAGAENTNKLPEIAGILQQYKLEAEDSIVSTNEQPVPFSNSQSNDENFIEGKKYTFPTGVNGKYTREYHKVTLKGETIAEYSIAGDSLSEPINEVAYYGKKSAADVKKQLSDLWVELKSAITKKEIPTLQNLLSANEQKNLNNLVNLSNISYRLNTTPEIEIADEILENSSDVTIGTATIKQQNCDATGVITILYQKEKKQYVFDGVYETLNSLCSGPKPAALALGPGVTTLTCKNCWLSPVSKKYALPANYAPYVVASELNGGGYVTPDTKNALKNLFNDALAKGVDYVRISSSYRSYSTQVTLFNSYVNQEQKNGLSYAQAVEKANTYSAKAGQSEHQLGTTVDIMGCPAPCNLYSSANDKLYAYLRVHAHEFGFIISYPNGSQPYTGYVNEPWHIRYIGVDLATELHNKGYLTKTGYYLNKFLEEKKRW